MIFCGRTLARSSTEPEEPRCGTSRATARRSKVTRNTNITGGDGAGHSSQRLRVGVRWHDLKMHQKRDHEGMQNPEGTEGGQGTETEEGQMAHYCVCNSVNEVFFFFVEI